MVEARFICNSKVGTEESGESDISFHADYNNGKGNEQWAASTPSGYIRMILDNTKTEAATQFERGKRYKVTFEECND